MKMNEAVEIAKKGTHCGMCKIDFLGTGVCSAGKKYGFVAYWPEGRMELTLALAAGTVKPTKMLLDIVNSCTLCGICDYQCHFITHLRPMKVQQALKEYVAHLNDSDLVVVPEDAVLKELRAVVGAQWATNDPVIIASYTKTSKTVGSGFDFYVVLPKTTEEVARIVALAEKHGIPYLPRGNGSFLSMAMQTLLDKAVGLDNGIIIDMRRMDTLEIHPESWTATIGPGVTAFDLQKAAYKHGMRALVAEAEAHVCVNIASFGIISTWGNTYGWGSDNVVDAEFVSSKGTVFRLSDKDVENPYATDNNFLNLTLTPPRIITEATVKLYPIFNDEEAVLVPFERYEDALDLAIALAKRDVGLSLGIMSGKYLAEFICPTNQLAEDFQFIAKKYLKMNYLVDIICDKYDRKVVEDLAEVIIDKSMIKTLMLGSSKLASMKESEFLKVLSEEKDPLKALFTGPMRKHLEKGLEATPEQIAKVFDKDLQGFFTKLYSRPEMTDAVWLHAFRILPSRLLRQKMFMVRGGFMPADAKLIMNLTSMLKEVGDKYSLENALGFVSFLEHGKLAFLEYDYYYDHTSPEAHARLNQAIVESLQKKLTMKGVIPIEYVFHKGLYRKEHFFYPLPTGLSVDDLKVFGEVVQSVLG
jgi:UDP-N-acetylenolpyruvoylglucosamine reductase